jgi:hypothetical protein
MKHLIGTLYILVGILLFSFFHFDNFYSNTLITTINVSLFIIGLSYLISANINK